MRTISLVCIGYFNGWFENVTNILLMILRDITMEIGNNASKGWKLKMYTVYKKSRLEYIVPSADQWQLGTGCKYPKMFH